MGGDPITTYIHQDDPPSTGSTESCHFDAGWSETISVLQPLATLHTSYWIAPFRKQETKVSRNSYISCEKIGTCLEWMGYHTLYNLNKQFFSAILLTSQNGSHSFLLCFFYASTPSFIAFFLFQIPCLTEKHHKKHTKKIFQTEKRESPETKKNSIT